MLKGLEDPSCEAARHEVVEPGEEKASGRTYRTFQYLKGTKEIWRRAFDKGMEWQDKRNGFQLKEGRIRLGARKKSFTVGMMRHCNRLPKKLWVPQA